jgi:hypothetical protein
MLPLPATARGSGGSSESVHQQKPRADRQREHGDAKQRADRVFFAENECEKRETNRGKHPDHTTSQISLRRHRRVDKILDQLG